MLRTSVFHGDSTGKSSHSYFKTTSEDQTFKAKETSKVFGVDFTIGGTLYLFVCFCCFLAFVGGLPNFFLYVSTFCTLIFWKMTWFITASSPKVDIVVIVQLP